MFGVESIIGGWNNAAPLREFGHALEAAFDANLGYSFLFKLWQFNNRRIETWVDGEKLRVIPVVADNATFRSDRFIRILDGLEHTFKVLAKITNCAVVCWAIVAAIGAMLALCNIPYCSSICMVTRSQMFLWGIFFLGALPAGFLVFCFSHLLARAVMFANSFSFRTIEKFFNPEHDAQVLEQKREALRQKLAAARAQA